MGDWTDWERIPIHKNVLLVDALIVSKHSLLGVTLRNSPRKDPY